MDVTSTLVGMGSELSVLFLTFGIIFAYAIVRGQRALISLIFGLYIGLLLSIEFPYYEKLSFASTATVRVVLFAIFAGFATYMFGRLLSRVIDSFAIEGIVKKIILSLLATTLVLSYCYHVLHVADLINPGAKISALFAVNEYFFWWLLAPLVGIFILF